jgi:hypothetical protein
VAAADFNAPGLQGLRDPAHQVDLKQAVLEVGALDLDMIGEAPHDVVGRIVPEISVAPVRQERAPAARDVAPRPVALFELHGGAPWLFQYALQRHCVGRPFGVSEPLHEGGVVVEPADAVALPQRCLGFVLAPEGDNFGAVFFRHVLVVEGTLDAADLLVLELFPAREPAESALGCQFEKAEASVGRRVLGSSQ